MLRVDLHIHTYFSDGKYSPESILERAAAIGLKEIAFTDHDNANAARHIRSMAPGTVPPDIEVIPAIEFTTTWPGLDVLPGGSDIDLLAYFVDLDSEPLKTLEKAAQEDISQRIADCCQRLTGAGYLVTMDEVWAENRRHPSLASLTFALRRKGYAASQEEAEELMFAAWDTVRPSKHEIGAVIATIHAAGGIAVLAHPGAIARRGGLVGAGEVGELAALGLDGLEIFHFRNDGAARQKLLALARQFDLVVSGGSDMHGWLHGLEHLGTQPVSVEMLEALRSRKIIG